MGPDAGAGWPAAPGARGGARRPPAQHAGGPGPSLKGLGTGALPSLWDRLGEVTMPVTLIAGGRDEKFSQIAERMSERLPVSRLQLVNGAGHAVHLEAPERVAEFIAAS